MWKTVRGKGEGIKIVLAHLDHQGDECLIWPLSCDDKGYGQLGYMGRVWKAHRLICIKVHGHPPSPDHEAAHSCGNGHRGCFNPKHLSWKTRSGNSRDAVEHGRYGKGVGWKGKLTKESVSEIKALVGRMTNIQLGLVYGVHAETIAKIRRGETWRKVS